jgi:hypothetical protein
MSAGMIYAVDWPDHNLKSVPGLVIQLAQWWDHTAGADAHRFEFRKCITIDSPRLPGRKFIDSRLTSAVVCWIHTVCSDVLTPGLRWQTVIETWRPFLSPRPRCRRCETAVDRVCGSSSRFDHSRVDLLRSQERAMVLKFIKALPLNARRGC